MVETVILIFKGFDQVKGLILMRTLIEKIGD